MVTTEVLVAVSDEEIEDLTAKSSEQLRQYVSSTDNLHTLHWNDKLQAKNVVDDFGRESSSSSSEKYERLDLDIYWDSLHWLLTGSPDAESVAPHVKLYHYAKKTTHKNLYEITQMENRVTYRFGPLSPHGTRTVTKIFTDNDLAEADVLSNLEDKFDKGYRTAFISDPEDRAPKSHSKKRTFQSLAPEAGGSSSARKGKKKKEEKQEELEEKLEEKGPEEKQEEEMKQGKEEMKQGEKEEEEKRQGEEKKDEGEARERKRPEDEESESEQPREHPPSQASQTIPTSQQQPPPQETKETSESTSSGLTAAEIVAQHSRHRVEAEERAMERLSTDPKAAYPVSAPDTQQAKSSASDLVPIPSVKVYEQLKKRSRAPVEPSDLTPAQLNLELERYGLSLEGGLKKKLARLSLHLMKLFPVEKHPHELGFLAGGGKVLTDHLFKGELRAVSAREAREFCRALEKLGDETLRERFNVDQANQLLFRSVKRFKEDDVEKLLHYAHSLGVFLRGVVKEEKGFLVYLK